MYMLSSEHRLRHKKDFETVFTKGLRTNGAGLGLRFGKRYKPEVPTRFGFVVGLKVSKNSVERNQLKRRMREAVRALKSRVPVGYDIVFIAFPEAKGMELAAVRGQIETMLKKAKLLV